VEKLLIESLGVKKILWLNEGLVNDHTDGHIDTMARFVAPGKVLCMSTVDRTDPNYEIQKAIKKDLQKMTDAQDRALTVGEIPSAGTILSEEGRIMPASYLNFYIGNSTVVVPTYGAPQDREAVAAIKEWFPHRKTVGLSAKSILTGGGAFHCISQQQPLLR
jgi:agmatine deiminase